MTLEHCSVLIGNGVLMELHDSRNVIGCCRCGDCCGPVVVSASERKRIKNWCEEHYGVEFGAPTYGQYTCRFFDKERGCLIYPVRPALCRLFGVVDVPLMTCPHGARADKLLTKAETEWLLPDEGVIL